MLEALEQRLRHFLVGNPVGLVDRRALQVDRDAALADALETVLADPASVGATTKAARDRFDSEFAPGAVVKALVDVYERALTPSRHRTSAT